MTIDAREYVESGSSRPVTVEQVAGIIAGRGTSWCLVELTDPVPAHWRQVAHVLGLPARIAELIGDHQLGPTFMAIDGFTTGLAHSLDRGAPRRALHLGDVAFVAGSRLLVVMRSAEPAKVAGPGTGTAGALQTYLESTPTAATGPDAAFYAGYRLLTLQYRSVVTELEHEVDRLEQEVFAPGRGAHSESIHRQTRQLIECKRAIGSLLDTVSDALEADGDRHARPATTSTQRRQLRLLLSHLQRANGQVETLEALLASIMNAEQGNISARQNDDMRKISAYVALGAVPTLLAGIYGMNFIHMPELRWRIGYPLVIAVMLGVCAVLARMFRRAGWL